MTLEQIIAHAKTKTPCAEHYQCLLADLTKLAEAQPSPRAETALALIDALPRIVPSDLVGDEQWNANGEYVLLSEVQDALAAATAERTPPPYTSYLAAVESGSIADISSDRQPPAERTSPECTCWYGIDGQLHREKCDRHKELVTSQPPTERMEPQVEAVGNEARLKCSCDPIHATACDFHDARSSQYRYFYPHELGAAPKPDAGAKGTE